LPNGTAAVASIHRTSIKLGFKESADELRNYELAYIGGMWGLDQVVDEEARLAMESRPRPAPSPERKG
jgi:hypothetical protein